MTSALLARRFAAALGTQTKTDRLDARLIARMGAMIEPRPQAPALAVLAEPWPGAKGPLRFDGRGAR